MVPWHETWTVGGSLRITRKKEKDGFYEYYHHRIRSKPIPPVYVVVYTLISLSICPPAWQNDSNFSWCDKNQGLWWWSTSWYLFSFAMGVWVVLMLVRYSILMYREFCLQLKENRCYWIILVTSIDSISAVPLLPLNYYLIFSLYKSDPIFHPGYCMLLSFLMWWVPWMILDFYWMIKNKQEIISG